jgi:hypothetical protein
MYKILLSDDNESLFEPFKDIAFKMGIDLICFLDWESAQSHLDSFGVDNFIGLVIDGKGWLTADDKDATNKHVATALNWLHEQKGNGILLPTIIYTAFLESISEFYGKDDVVLGIEDKTTEFGQILQKILTNYMQNPDSRIKFRYKEVIGIFNDIIMSANSAPSMVGLLSKLEGPAVDKSNFNIVRDIIEDLLKNASRIDSKNFLPTALLKPSQGGRPNLKCCEIYFSGRPVDLTKCGGIGSIQAPMEIMPPHISRIFTMLVDNSSILSHNYTFSVTNYSYKSIVFGLCEVVLWFKDYCKTNYNI